MTTIELPSQVVAAVRAGIAGWVAVPATVPCPGCMACDPGDGIDVPFSPSPGDLLGLRAGDVLPADGTEFGEWTVRSLYKASDLWLTDGFQRLLPLNPGSVVPVRVTDGPLPIVPRTWVAEGFEGTRRDVVAMLPDGHPCAPGAHLWTDGSYTADITAHAAFDPESWTPGGRGIRVEVVT